MRALLLSRPAAIVGVAALLGLGAAGACSSTGVTTTFVPITGILVRSEPLVAGYGCGTGASQVYKYAAVVLYKGTTLTVDAGLYDCFADGVFVNLGPSATGSLDFTVKIYAYDKATFDADVAASTAGGGGAVASFVDAASHAKDVDGGGGTNDFDAIPATWTTTCVATQQSNVEVLAVCDKLVPAFAPSPGDAGGADGATDAPADAPGDGAVPDASGLQDAASPDGTSSDAGLPDTGLPDLGLPDILAG